MRMLGLALAALLLGGCAFNPPHVKEPDTWNQKGKVAITQEIGLISDTQFHESRGHPHHFLQRAGDEFVEVTIRSAQQVIGGDDLLRRALALSDSLPLVLHAGDALDLSCSSEWQRFQRVMESKGAPGAGTWIYTPGNHDGYMAGNLHRSGDSKSKTDHWANVCNVGMLDPAVQTPFRKTDVISAYARLLPAAQGNDVRCSADEKHCWVISIVKEEPWSSFIVQLVQLPAHSDSSPRIYALLLDSSNYRDRFLKGSISTAGVSGGVTREQLEAAIALKGRIKGDGRFFLVAHYPLAQWHMGRTDAELLGAWEALTKEPRFLNFIVTSHTHDGWLGRHSAYAGGIVEMNIGSLADAPIHMRTLQFQQDARGSIGFRSTAIHLTPTLAECRSRFPESQAPEFSADAQRTMRSTMADSPWLTRLWVGLVSAFRSSRDEVAAKHDELKFHLLVQAAVVGRTLPEDAGVQYQRPHHGASSPEQLRGRRQVADRLRQQANCHKSTDAAELAACTIPAKEDLLVALDTVYQGLDPKSKASTTAHEMRLCMALTAAEDSLSSRTRKDVDEVNLRIGTPWSMQLSPQLGAH